MSLPLFDVPAKATSLCMKLAMHFEQHPGEWIDGRVLATIAGTYGWRSRVSNIRKPPFRMEIENRVRTVTVNGDTFKVSEYRYVPAQSAVA